MKRPSRKVKIIGAIAAGVTVALVGVGAIFYQQGLVVQAITADEQQNVAGAASNAKLLSELDATAAKKVLADPFFRSNAWSDFVASQAAADQASLRDLRTRLSTEMDSQLWFPPARARWDSWVQKVDLSLTTAQRVDLYALVAVQGTCSGSPSRAVIDQMFAADATDKVVGDIVGLAKSYC